MNVRLSAGWLFACMDIIPYLNIEVSRLLEELHQNTFDTLALVQHSFCTNFESSNGFGIDRVFLEQGAEGGKGDGVDV